MKTCSKCGKTKPESEFYKDKSTESGFTRWCKSCYREYRSSDSGSAVQKRHSQSAACKLSQQRYRQSQKGKETASRYNRSDKGLAAASRHARTDKGKASAKRKREREPQKHKARGDVNNAVAAGGLPRIPTQECADCGNQAEQYHHPDYMKTLDVTPLCRECHSKRHC